MTARHAPFVLSPSLLAATLVLSMSGCSSSGPSISESGDADDSSEPPLRSLRLIVKSSSPQIVIDDFELSGTPEGSELSYVGHGVAQVEGLVGGFTSSVIADNHVEGFACVDTSGAEESQYTVVLTPLAPAQMIEDASLDAFIEYGGMSIFVPGGTLVDPDDPLTPVTGEVEFFATPIPFSELPESVSCPVGIVRENGEDLNATVGFMAMADFTPRKKDGTKLQIIDGGGVDVTLPVPPFLADQYLAAQDPPPLHFYSLNGEGYWEQTVDTQLVTNGDDASVSATLPHFSLWSEGFEVSAAAEDLTAHAIMPRSHEGREITYSTFNYGGISIGRISIPPGPEFGLQPPGCMEVTDLVNGEMIDIHYLSYPWLDYTLEANGVAGTCEEGNAVVHIEPLANPGGAPSGAPCLLGSDCSSGMCATGFNAEGQLSGMCGDCVYDHRCGEGGTCVPGSPLSPGGAHCTYGDIGDLCQANAGCQLDGSVCSGLVSIGEELLKTCGYCSTGGACGPGTSCHPIVDPDLAPLLFPAWNECVPDGTLPQDHICELTGSGDDACEGLCSKQLILGEMLYDVGACGECLDNTDCDMGEVCMPPPDLSGPMELFFGGLQGSTCVPG